MTPKSILRNSLIATGIALASPIIHANESNFKKDRAAILALAGKFEITFNFHETYSTANGYEIKTKKYSEKAHELVKVVEDTDTRIVLQHLLQVEGDEGSMVVKHWGQVWTFEDKEILEYQGETTWKKRQLNTDEARGTWSQYVTQTDDSPRYESYGKWDHSMGLSQWVSGQTNRPLPRREYKTRKDYDILVGINTHIITPQGWVHEQSNRKLVKRDNKRHYLCHERGFNTYFRVPDHDFSVAESYWKTHSKFRESVRAHWMALINKSNDVKYTRRINGKSMRKALHMLMADPEEKKAAAPEDIPKTLTPYLIKDR